MEKPTVAKEGHSLIGNWRLVSSQVIVDDRAHDLLGSSPKGYLILTPQGRLCAITTAGHRTAGEEDAQRATLTGQCWLIVGNTAFNTTTSLRWSTSPGMKLGMELSRDDTFGSKVISYS